MTISIEAFNVGWFTAPAGLMRRGDPLDQPARFPIPAYVIETGEHRILIDTGLHPSAVTGAAEYYEGADAMTIFTLEQEQSIAEQIDVATLTMVVLTHLHFDHAGGLPLIPATVPLVIQEREWAAAHAPASVQANGYLARDYAGTARPLVLVDGDHDLLGDGSIGLLFTPGHTPGHQSVRAGDLVIGADVCHYASALDDHRFPIFGHDLDQQARSAERLRALRDAGLTVLPGHDPDVLRPGREPLPSAL